MSLAMFIVELPTHYSTAYHRLARVTGHLYLILIVCGMFVPTAMKCPIVHGDDTQPSDSIMGSLGCLVSLS
jgi:hypothetical protein